MATPQLNTTTISGGGAAYSIYDVSGIGNANRFLMRTGASRYGVGVFLMVRSDWNAISNLDSVTLTMKGQPGPGLTLEVVPVKADPCITGTTSDDTGDLVRVTFYDMRCQNTDIFAPDGNQSAAYNVPVDGFPQDGGITQCYSETTNADGSAYSWDDILGDIFTSSSLPDDTPGWDPYGIIWDGIPTCRVIDDVARRLFYVVAYDHQADQTEDGDFGIQLQTPGDSLKANDSLHGVADIYITAGGLSDRNDQRLPGLCYVSFQVYNSTDSDPFSNRMYVSQQAIHNGNGDISCVMHIAEHIVVVGGSGSGTATADNIASDMVSRLAGWQWQDFGQQEYPGIWPFRPDGQWRQVEWISDSKGARTILSNDNRFDWSPGDSQHDPINPYSNDDLTPLGQVNAAAGTSGNKAFWAQNNRSVLVKVEATAGGGGKYTGHTYSASTNGEAENDESMPEGAVEGEAVTIVNVEEDSTGATWRLNIPCWAVGTFAYDTVSTESNVVFIRGALGSLADAKDLTATAGTARTATWDWTTDGKAVVVTIGGVAFWDGTLLKQPYFTMTIDARGVIRAISAETMRTVDTPVACS